MLSELWNKVSGGAQGVGGPLDKTLTFQGAMKLVSAAIMDGDTALDLHRLKFDSEQSVASEQNAALFGALGKCVTLQKLSLSGLILGGAAVESVVSLLGSGNYLTELDLSGCTISRDNAEKIVKAFLGKENSITLNLIGCRITQGDFVFDGLSLGNLVPKEKNVKGKILFKRDTSAKGTKEILTGLNASSNETGFVPSAATSPTRDFK